MLADPPSAAAARRLARRLVEGLVHLGRPPRAVLIGDSITEVWALSRPGFFRANRYVGRGISGQTSAQIAARFQRDALGPRPAAVLVLAGTNDMAENQGPVSDEAILENLVVMAQAARALGVAAAIGAIPPAAGFARRPHIRPAQRIQALNRRIAQWTQDQGLAFADFHAALALADGAMDPAFAEDGVHPNAAGYAVMEPLARAAIDQALIKSA